MADDSVEPSPAKEQMLMKNSMLRAIVTDVHFWVPVAVLILGIALLLILR
jgi:hypothetical protein